MRIKFFFAWYDLWIGAYWDYKKKRLYLMIPMIGFYIEFKSQFVPVEGDEDGERRSN